MANDPMTMPDVSAPVLSAAPGQSRVVAGEFGIPGVALRPDGRPAIPLTPEALFAPETLQAFKI